MKNGTLFIVATPIGNLDDITKRAIDIISSVDFVACEDTRVAGGLLHHLGIKKELISLHQHSSDEKIDYIIRELRRGKNIAYVSDSGTPGISDPGQALIVQIRNPNVEIRNKRNQIQNSNIQIIPIPGASAVTAAISISGMVDKEFYFVGFLPKKKGRETKFKELAVLKAPIVVYESAQRLEKTLNDIKSHFGAGLEVFLAREMTKKFEEYWGGDISEIISDLTLHVLKGEFVLIVSRK